MLEYSVLNKKPVPIRHTSCHSIHIICAREPEKSFGLDWSIGDLVDRYGEPRGKIETLRVSSDF